MNTPNPVATMEIPKGHQPRWEAVAVVCIIGTVLLINVLVAGRTPTVFNDEPPYTDAAANLYFGKGFVSTLWGQDRHAFWSGNVPFYQGALYLGFKLFGFGLKEARWTNAILLSAGGVMIWLASTRSLLLRHPVSRLICITSVLSGAVSTLTFRTVRPDVMMFFVCCIVFLACSIQPPKPRFAAVALAVALLPFAGIPLLPYAAMAALLYAAIFGRPAIPTTGAIGLGLAGGVGLLALFYSQVSSIKDFLSVVLPFTVLGNSSLTLRQWLMEKITGVPPETPENLLTCFFGDPRELMNQKTLCDYGAIVLFVLAVAVVLARYRQFDQQTKRIALFLIAMTVVVPPFMHFVGHYKSYYRWMTYVPLCIGAPLLVERAMASQSSLRLGGWAALVFMAAIAMGVPLRTVNALTSWNSRSTGPIEQAAALVIRPTDIVICNFKDYFAIRPRARLLFATRLTATGEFKRIVDLPKDDVSVLCLAPDEEAEIISQVGGKWEPVALPDKLASALAATRYDARFFRRIPGNP